MEKVTKTREICYFVILTALYVVLSAFCKFYIGIGHIQVDLGYIAFAVALSMFGMDGTVVGVIGCALESILFTTYGFSVSWAVANLIIGIGCGFVFKKSPYHFIKVIAIILFCAVGFIAAKTMIECYLYAIPIVVKLPKSIAAWCVDSATMIVGLTVYEAIKRRMQV